MADLRKLYKEINPWEVLLAFFGYFAIAKDVPTNIRTLQIPRLVPDLVKNKLLQWNSSGDFWVLLSFTCFVIFALSILLLRPDSSKKECDKDRIIRTVSRRFRLY